MSKDGKQSEFEKCLFCEAVLNDGACFETNFTDTDFIDCELSEFQFSEVYWHSGAFEGDYDDLWFSPSQDNPRRNVLALDVRLLNVYRGIDLSKMRLPDDGSALVVKNPDEAIPKIASKLRQSREQAANLLAERLVQVFTSEGQGKKKNRFFGKQWNQIYYYISLTTVNALVPEAEEELLGEYFRLVKQVSDELGYTAGLYES